MKNLKRILSLALASVMVMGMMVVGASAAFNDQADINANNVDAVNTMVALKILSGKEGNQFDPKGGVTRAEMATMIAMALNGGNADFRGTTTTGFTDVDGAKPHWAAKFIKYCVDQGILSGVGGGKFNPDANVTAQEAATMVLTAMGYKKEMLKSETSDWAAKINLKAEQRDLYEDTTITDYIQTIDRQTAAQMIYNGITVGTPIVRDTYNTTTGEHEYSVTSEAGNPSILTTAFKAHMEYAVLTGSKYNAKTGKFTYTMDSSNVNVDPLAGSRGADGKPVGAEGLTLTSEVDVSELFQQKVKVIYSDSNDKVTKDTVVIGITSISDCVLSTGTVGSMKINSTNTAIDGFGITGNVAASAIDTYAFNGGEHEKKGWETYTLIDNNDDGRADCLVINPVVVAKVTGKSSSVLTTSQGRFVYEDNDIAADLAIGDWVTITPAIKVDNVIKALEPIENVTATVKTAKDIYTIGGQSYRAKSWTGKAFNDTTNAELKDVELGKAYTLVALNGYVFDAEEYDDGTSVSIDDVLLVTAVAKDVNTGADTEVSKGTAYHEVNAVFTDGKSQPIKVSKIYDATANGGKGGYANVSASNKVSVTEALYSFTVDANGYYRIKALPTTNNDPWERYTAKTIADGETVKDGKTSGTNVVRFDNNAVVFVKAEGILDENGNTTYRVVNGAEVNKWNEATGTELDAGLAYTKTVSGFPYAGLAFLTLEATKDIWPMGTSGLKYGYLTAATVEAYDAATKASVAQLTIWNGEEEVTRTATLGDDGVVTALSAYPAGKLISYKETSDGQLSELNDLTETTLGTWEANKANAGVVLAYNNGTDIQIAPSQIKHLGTPSEAPKLTAKEFDMDANETVVIYIDQAEGEGVASGAITLADLDGDNDYINNVYAVVDKTDATAKLLALFVEVNNEAKAQIPTNDVETVGIDGDTAAESIVVTVTGDAKKGNTLTVTATVGASIDEIAAKTVSCTVTYGDSDTAITATPGSGNGTKGPGTYTWTFVVPDAIGATDEITVTVTAAK